MNHCSNRRCHHTGYHRLLGARHASGTARRPASPARSAPPGKNTACAASGPPTAPPGGPTSQQPGCYPCYLAPLHAAAAPDSQAAGQSLRAAQAPCGAAPGGSRITVPLQHGGTYLRTTRPYTQPATGRSTRGVPGQCAPAATQTLERAPFRRACAPTASGLSVQRCRCSGSYPARACARR